MPRRRGAQQSRRDPTWCRELEPLWSRTRIMRLGDALRRRSRWGTEGLIASLVLQTARSPCHRRRPGVYRIRGGDSRIVHIGEGMDQARASRSIAERHHRRQSAGASPRSRAAAGVFVGRQRGLGAPPAAGAGERPDRRVGARHRLAAVRAVLRAGLIDQASATIPSHRSVSATPGCSMRLRTASACVNARCASAGSWLAKYASPQTWAASASPQAYWQSGCRREVERLAGGLDGLRWIGPCQSDARERNQQLDPQQAIAARYGMEQTRLGLAERSLRVATGEQVSRCKKVRFDDALHLAGARGPGADLVEVGRGVHALRQVDAGQQRVEQRDLVVPVAAASLRPGRGRRARGRRRRRPGRGDGGRTAIRSDERVACLPARSRRQSLRARRRCRPGRGRRSRDSASEFVSSDLVFRRLSFVHGLGREPPGFGQEAQGERDVAGVLEPGRCLLGLSKRLYSSYRRVVGSPTPRPAGRAWPANRARSLARNDRRRAIHRRAEVLGPAGRR